MVDDDPWSVAGLRRTVRPVLRVVVAGLLLGPGASKFLTYGASVRFFDALGLPSPHLLVPVVGAVELAAAALLLLDRAPRLAAVAAVPVMVVAAATAGPTWQNLAVLVAAVALLAFDTTADGSPESAKYTRTL